MQAIRRKVLVPMCREKRESSLKYEEKRTEMPWNNKKYKLRNIQKRRGN
jgi:hypothetical protein